MLCCFCHQSHALLRSTNSNPIVVKCLLPSLTYQWLYSHYYWWHYHNNFNVFCSCWLILWILKLHIAFVEQKSQCLPILIVYFAKSGVILVLVLDFVSMVINRSSSASSFLLVQSYLLIFWAIINYLYFFQSEIYLCIDIYISFGFWNWIDQVRMWLQL